jgi:hypothetical protein
MMQVNKKRKFESVEDEENSFQQINQDEKLYFEFDRRATRGELVELHTHLMGMGSADFWVNRIMKVFIRNIVSRTGRRDVGYTVDDIWTASGLRFPQHVGSKSTASWKRAILEAKILDGVNKKMEDIFEQRQNKDDPNKFDWVITNNKLFEILEESSNGALLAMMRNWFEFLDVNGNSPSYSDILQTCNVYQVISLSF